VGEDVLDKREQATGAPVENQPRPIAILNVGRMNDDVQQEAERIDKDVALAPLVLAPLTLARRYVQGVVDALQRAIPIPQHEIRMRGALRRQILRQCLPLATRREHVEDRVQHLADVHLASTPTAFGRRYRRFDQRPLAVAQITRVAQAVAVGSTALFRLPHEAPLSSDSGAREGITTDSSDSTTLWIGSQTLQRHLA